MKPSFPQHNNQDQVRKQEKSIPHLTEKLFLQQLMLLFSGKDNVSGDPAVFLADNSGRVQGMELVIFLC